MMNRRQFLTTSGIALGSLYAGTAPSPAMAQGTGGSRQARPNILFAMADDWSWPHASAYGARYINTPVFDRVAQEGCLCRNAFVAAPQCSPNRAAILTGRHIWQIEEAGTHASIFPNKFDVFPDLLEQAGYHVGYTGKGWSPGDWKRGGWERNPAGPSYNSRKLSDLPADGIHRTDYAGNFEDFLAERPKDEPFCFWFGGYEPHRTYEAGSGRESGKALSDAEVPSFLPDSETVRDDLLDYAVEIEWFDKHLGRMLEMLEAQGELDNTLVVVTGDNGMPFPGAKANLYEHGTHVPLAIRWPQHITPGRDVKELISFVDFAPTFLDAAGLPSHPAMSGRSLVPLLSGSGTPGEQRNFVLSGRERHTHARYDNLGYPGRAIRTQDYLFIRNIKPERWPAGKPEGYHDIDPCPSKTYLMEHREEYPELFERSFGMRPAEELFDIRKDPGCLHNLAHDPEYVPIADRLSTKLNHLLTAQKDPRMLGCGDIFESYPRVSHMREELGGFTERGAYNPKYQKGE